MPETTRSPSRISETGTGDSPKVLARERLETWGQRHSVAAPTPLYYHSGRVIPGEFSRSICNQQCVVLGARLVLPSTRERARSGVKVPWQLKRRHRPENRMRSELFWGASGTDAGTSCEC